MRRLIVTCAVLAACHGAGNAPEPVPEAPPTLRYAADSAHYLLVSHRTGEQEMQGQVNRQTQRTQYWLGATLAAAEGDTLATRFLVDSVTESGGAFGSGDLTQVRGAEWTARLAPNGQLLNFDGPSAAGVSSQLANLLSQFYPRIPEEGLTAGAAWVDTVTGDVDVGGVVLTITAVHHNEAVGPAEFDAVPAFLIRVVSEYTMSGQGSQSGQPLTLDGTGRRHVREYLTPTGHYLGRVAADTSQFDVVLTALGMSIPGRQWRYDTLKVVQ